MHKPNVSKKIEIQRNKKTHHIYKIRYVGRRSRNSAMRNIMLVRAVEHDETAHIGAHQPQSVFKIICSSTFGICWKINGDFLFCTITVSCLLFLFVP